MKVFSNKKILYKIVIILAIVIACSFIMPNSISNAETFTKDSEGTVGGKMLEPIVNFLMYIGDAILSILQNNFLSENPILMEAQANDYAKFNGWALFTIVLSVIGFVVGICLAVPTGGASVVGSIKAFAIGAAVVAGSSFVMYKATSTFMDDLQGNFDIPLIQYTPYAIFSGQIPALDINFINPKEPLLRKKPTVKEATREIALDLVANKLVDDYDASETSSFVIQPPSVLNIFWDRYSELNDYKKSYGYNAAKKNNELYDLGIFDENNNLFNFSYSTLEAWVFNEKVYALKMVKQVTSITDPISGMMTTETWEYYYTYKLGDEQSFSKEIVSSYIDENTTYYESSSSILQSSIATWYKVLRTVALVGLLTVLIYIGIRILFTSVAADKAKYKKMLIDWVVAICILFILHYLMIFILTISNKLTEIVIPKATGNLVFSLPKDTKIGEGDTSKSLVEYAKEQISTYEDLGYTLDEKDNLIKDKNGNPTWVGDYVGYIRLVAGVNTKSTAVVYGIMYLVLVIYTCMFTFMYLKRVLYMAFLTMIAPLIALTYPLDKIKDGKAQAFSLWLREFIFNALIQPVHLILYTMVMSTVLDLAVEHPVYAIVALGFFTPAERFIRKMFGFDNAGTVSALGQMAGGAAVMGAVNKLSKLNKRKKKDDDEAENNNVRTKEAGGHGLPFAPGGQNENNGEEGNKNSPIRQKNNEGDLEREDSQQDNTNENNNPKTYDDRLSQEQKDELMAEGIEPGDAEYDNALANYGLNKRENTAETPDSNKNNIQQKQTDDNSKEKSEIKFKDVIKNGAKKVGNGAKKVGNHYRKKALKAKPLRAVGKWSGRILGGATLGTVGLAAGIATGDASKAFSYTAAGAGVGGALGGTVAENVMDEGKELKENFSKGYQGEAEYTNKKLDREYYNGTAKGDTFQDMLAQKDLYSNLSGNNRKKKMKEDIQEYRKSGITENSNISTCMRAGLTPEEGVYAVQISKAMEKSGWNNSKIKKDYETNCKKLLKDNNIEEERINKIWDTVPKLLF